MAAKDSVGSQLASRTMPVGTWLECASCGRHYDEAPLGAGCPACDALGLVGQLEVRYAYADRLRGTDTRALFATPQPFWAYAPLLPGEAGDVLLDLGQGLTPVVPLQDAEGALPRVTYAKLEGCNPTASFKDRYMAVAVSMALRMGERRLVGSSTGNGGAALAAFAARARADSLILCPRDTSPTTSAQIGAYGGRVMITEGDARRTLMAHLVDRYGWTPIGVFMPDRFGNPWGVEGYKTIAYELHAQLGERIDWLVFPCARGNGLYGAWKGFHELRMLGLRGSVPHMIAVQPDGAATLSRSIAEGRSDSVNLHAPTSIAMAIREPIASDRAIAAIRESDGLAVSVPDPEIIDAWTALGRQGIYVELSSAAAVAGLRRAAAMGVVKPGDQVVCVLTAAGTKRPEDHQAYGMVQPREIAGTTKALDQALEDTGMADPDGWSSGEGA